MEYKLRLRDLRNLRGLTQRQIANGLGICPAAVAKWELGSNNITVTNLLALAKLLDCSLDQLVELSHKDNPRAG